MRIAFLVELRQVALVLSDTMEQRQLRSNDATRAVLVRACALGGFWQQGLSVLAEVGTEVRPQKQKPPVLPFRV